LARLRLAKENPGEKKCSAKRTLFGQANESFAFVRWTKKNAFG